MSEMKRLRAQVKKRRAMLAESRSAVDLLREKGVVPYATLEQERRDSDALLAAERAAADAEIARLRRLLAPVVRELRGWVEVDLEAGNDSSAVVAVLEPAEAALREEAGDA